MVELNLKVENLVTFSQAARDLGVSRPTVYNMVAKFRLHPVEIGSNRYLLRNEVEFLKTEMGQSKKKVAAG